MDAHMIEIIDNWIKGDRTHMNEVLEYLGTPEKELNYIIHQYQFFQLVSKGVETNYVNYFKGIDIFKLELKEEHSKTTFYICLILFFQVEMKGKNVIYCDLNDDYYANDINKFLKCFPYREEYKYDITINDFTLSFEHIFYFFSLINRNIIAVDISFEVYYDLLKTNIDYIHFLMLGYNLTNEDALKYSIKCPNRIHCIKVKKNIIDDSIRKIVELNKESLINLPFFDIELIKQMPNLTSILFDKKPPIEIPSDVDFSKITIIEILVNQINSKEERNELIHLYLSYIDKCTNLNTLIFNFGENNDKELYWFFFPILMNMKSNKLLHIEGYLDISDNSLDCEPIIEKFPYLQTLYLCHEPNDHPRFQTMNKIKPKNYPNGYGYFIFDSPNLYKLINNYLKSNVDHYISLYGNNSNSIHYLYDKTDVTKRIRDIWFFSFSEQKNLIQNLKYLPSFSIGNINDINKIKMFNKVKILYIYVKINDEELLQLIKKVQPEEIFIDYEDFNLAQDIISFS